MTHLLKPCTLLLAALILGGCAGGGAMRPAPGGGDTAPARPLEPGTYEVFGKRYRVLTESRGYLEIGIASWYGRKFHGKLTANGEVYDMYSPSAAHRSLPLPTFVKVTNLNNQRHIILRVNDRGPFHSDRLIDLSYQAAVALDFVANGTAPVVVEALDELNYPDALLAQPAASAVPAHAESYYLQLGAFRELRGAERLVTDTRDLMARNNMDSIQIRILSEENEELTLHKVWMGPFYTEEAREQVVALVESAELATPIRVQVD